MKTEIIPFGKYKGQPVSQLRHDPEYVEWLVSQDWFPKRYRDINTLIINNFKEPGETPEHNKLQMRFLDDDFIQAVVSHESPLMSKVWQRWKTTQQNEDKWVEEDSVAVAWSGKEDWHKVNVRFESADGWDVVIYQEFVYRWTLSESKTGRWRGVRRDHHGSEERVNLYGELKPSIGDDYPRILRECKSRGAPNGHRFVMYENYTGSGATEQQVRKLYGIENVRLVCVNEIKKGDT